jgi:signal peptidase I
LLLSISQPGSCREPAIGQEEAMNWLTGLDVRSVLILAGLFLIARSGFLRSRRLYPFLRSTLTQISEVALVSFVVVFLVLNRFLFQLFFIPSGSMIPTLAIQDRLVVNKFAYRVQQPQRGEVVVFRAPREASEEPCDFIKRVVGLPGETVSVVPDTLCLDGKPIAPIILMSDARTTGDGLLVEEEADVRVEEDRVRVDGRTVLVAAPTGKVQALGQALLVDGRLERLLQTEETLHPRPVRPATDGIRAEGTVIVSRGHQDRPRLVVVKGRRLTLRPGYVCINGRRLPESYVRETPRYAMAPVRLGAGQYLVLGDNRNNSKDGHVWGALDGSRIIGRAEAIYWPFHHARRLTGERPVAHAGIW